MNLIQKAFNSIPDWLKVRVFELNNDEKWFLETSKKAEKLVSACICEPTKEDARECENIKREMEFILNNRKNSIRFQKYFSEKVDYVGYLIKSLNRYR